MAHTTVEMPAAFRSIASSWLVTRDRTNWAFRQHLALEASGVDEVVDLGQRPLQPRLGGGKRHGQVVAEPHPVTVRVGKPAGDHDARLVQRRQVEIVGGRLPAQLDGRFAAGQSRVADLVDRAAQRTDLLQPPHDVHAAVPPRHPGVRPDRQDNLATGLAKLGSDLCAGSRGADYEDAAVRQLIRVAVPVGVDLPDGRIED